MLHRFRGHVPELAAGLSLVSLAAVFATALGYVPTDAIPRLPAGLIGAIPHVNAVISLLAVGTIGAGWRWARRGDIRRHRLAMLTSTVLFATFLVAYLYKVALEGPTPFSGPAVVATYVYLPVLVIHVSLAVVCVPLVYYVLLLALTRPIAAIPATRHPRLGRLAASLWLVSFGLGLVVYGLLYHVY